MQQREKILAIGFTIALVLWQGWPLIQRTFFQPLDDLRAELKAIEGNIEAKDGKQLQMIQTAGRLADWRNQSLPQNDLDAQRLYQQWLTDLTQLSGWKDVRVSPGRRIDRGERYAALQVAVEGTATMEEFAMFLYHFDRINLLHRIERLGIERRDDSDNAALRISLVAEGVSLETASDTDELFPRARLAREAGRSDRKIQLTPADAPFVAGLRVRIGDEYVRLTAQEDDAWTVERGIDGTSAASHAAGVILEAAPIAADEAEQDWSGYSRMIADSPFRRASPAAAPPVRTPPPQNDEARDFRLVASVVRGDEPQAWLHNAQKNQRIVLSEEGTFSISDISARVVEIARTHIVFEASGATWKLELGDSLRSMSRVSDPTQPSPSPTAVTPDSDGESSAPVATESPDN
ncbi:MAG: hypothetical protein ACE37I_06655 [Rubinisphaera brasiliensis]|uniref:hypothetical protein n=1 Tax=Rubinisphaera brasiliensis TaxID=119 RepID=UPI00391D3BC9